MTSYGDEWIVNALGQNTQQAAFWTLLLLVTKDFSLSNSNINIALRTLVTKVF